MADRLPLPLPPTDAGPVSFVQTAAAAIDGAVALALSALVTASRTLGNRNDNNDADRYMTGGAYDLALDHAVADGYRAIHARLSALRADAAASGGPAPVPLVVFDVDDTLLSTRSGHRLQPTVTMGSYATARDAFLPPLEPVVRLYQQLWNDGVRTAIVTGRWATESDATLANLYQVGVGGWDHALFRTPGATDAYLSARNYKQHQRARLTAAGYEIIGVVGDQHSDMAYDAPGVVNIKLPNPMYTIY
ncbi:Haloacid dehydrogenase [Pandoravirus quercus]|uniref:Haloacid dehydrogenase n=1 Tax=Pandoravirus quercus TaxID=2107709 RepID=A0A2U7U7V2_9VIRU|nr:Haloacid dehydrogenase [Pandoravirus quercus]AVK74499.1 Haloacid dehydrogenase [Pandoravirus quercus]